MRVWQLVFVGPGGTLMGQQVRSEDVRTDFDARHMASQSAWDRQQACILFESGKGKRDRFVSMFDSKGREPAGHLAGLPVRS